MDYFKKNKQTLTGFLLGLLDAMGIAGRMYYTFTRRTFFIFWTCALYAMFAALWRHVLTQAQCKFVNTLIGQLTMKVPIPYFRSMGWGLSHENEEYALRKN